MVLTLLKVFLKLQYFFKKKILVKITGFYFSKEAQDKSFFFRELLIKKLKKFFSAHPESHGYIFGFPLGWVGGSGPS